MAGGRTIDEQSDNTSKNESSQLDAAITLAIPQCGFGNPTLPVSAPFCRRIRNDCQFATNLADSLCIDCAFLEEKQLGENNEIEFLKHCRVIRDFVEQSASVLFSSHVASILLTPNGRVFDCDQRGQAFLRSSGLLSILHNRLRCSDPGQDSNVQEAIKKTAKQGRATALLLTPTERPQQRYSLVFVSLAKGMSIAAENVLCLVAPLDRRRFATARQLMELFGLSAAEARLARALCHGDSLEEYATDLGLKLPTVRTQLRSVFAKTATERQASLVRLLSGIPVVRDE